ncbi:MAG TPA: T9SS type A sorting domain-containing protein, partial [Bacteroidetes bacterium]|nr:T9SS type A sorting domain-containing protein [Bacteroidota bacterium]
NGVDLNRDFPDPKIGANSPYEIETEAFMNYAMSRNFVFSANFHGGIELANFPWDAWNSSDNPHPDHNWFYTVSRQYADQAQANSPSGYFTGLNNGVTQGGDWYVISGGRQDYMNYWHSCKEITIEVSDIKNPASAELPNFWNYNKEALLSYIEWLYTGIQGTVTNEQGDPLNATIAIDGHDQYNSHVVTNPNTGFYVRMIEPETYNVMYSAEGYIGQVHTIAVSSYTSFVPKDVVLVQAAQTSLSGVVTDSNTGYPINGVKVELQNSSTISPVYTNALGEYSFGSIPENIYQVKASMQGYLSQTVTQTLTGESNTINFGLVPSNAESFEAGVPEGFVFEGVNWVRDNSTAYDGDYSMRSGSISNNQTTSMEITLNVVSSDDIVFFYKVSSESGYDYLKFYIDDVEKASWSGEVDWTEVSFPVPSGVHTFRWSYEKDGSLSNGSDCAWVDNIIFPQTQSDVVFEVTTNGSPLEGAIVNFNQNSKITNAQGIANFSNVLRGTSKEYSVAKDGFETETGTVSVLYVDVTEVVPLVISSVINADWNVEQLSMWPNPFTDNLNIRFYLSSASNVTVEVYTITGQKVATAANGYMHKGEHQVEWKAFNGDVPLVPGVYLVQIKTNEGQQTARVIFSGK